MHLFSSERHLARAIVDGRRLRPRSRLRFKSLVAVSGKSGDYRVTPPTLWDEDEAMEVYQKAARDAGWKPQYIIRIKEFKT